MRPLSDKKEFLNSSQSGDSLIPIVESARSGILVGESVPRPPLVSCKMTALNAETKRKQASGARGTTLPTLSTSQTAREGPRPYLGANMRIAAVAGQD